MGMLNFGKEVTAGAGGLRDAYLRYAEEQMTNGAKPLPPAEWLKMIQTMQQQQQQPQSLQTPPIPPRGGMMFPAR